MIFSIIIPTYNRFEEIKKCLIDFENQNFPQKDYEIIIIDDGSTDKSFSKLNTLKNTLKNNIRIFKKKNRGPASARNFGIRIARGKYILFIDDDMYPSNNLLKEHQSFHKKYKNSAILGNILWNPNLRVTPFMKYAALYGYQFAYRMIKDPLNLDYNLFYTSNISLERKWFNKDKFNERFRTPACEDGELAYRLQKKGLRIVFNKEAINYHSHFFSFYNFCERQYRVGENLKILFNIHPELQKNLDFYKNLSDHNFILFRIYARIISLFDVFGVSFPKKIYNPILNCYTYKGIKSKSF